jgi:hypothetical protein
MIKIALLTFLLIFLSSCHQGSSYVSRYGQSIVLNPNQKEVKEIKSENILNKEPNKLAKKEQTKNNYTKVNSDIFKNINFSSTKFLKGNADCVDIIRVKVVGSLSYDQLMYELKKRAQTMGGNAIGIQDLKENKEVTYTNQRVIEKNSDDIKNTLIKETNMLSSVTADIFKCDSNI